MNFDDDDFESMAEFMRAYNKHVHNFMRTFQNRVKDLIEEGFDPINASIIAVNENNDKVKKELKDNDTSK